MLSDPQSVTISGTPISLPRLETRAKTNVYADRASNTTLYVTQDVAKNGDAKATASLVRTEIYTDPITGIKRQIPTSITVVASIPLGGSVTTAEALYDALTGNLEASTKAALKRILAGEK